MKKLLFLLTLGFAIQSNAMILVHSFSASQGQSSKLSLSTIGCIFLLPLCILDEEGAQGSLSSEFLLENGYDQQTIDKILVDQKETMIEAHQKDMKLVITNSDTKDSIASDIYTINPNVSTDYLNFVIDESGL